MVNVDLFQKIDRELTGHPEQHDQSSWESDCGTTRCVAGWAIHLVIGRQSLYHPSGLGWSDAHYQLHEQLGVPMSMHGPGSLAAKLLGLSVREAEILFHHTTNEQARRAVRLAAAGDIDGFRDFLREVDEVYVEGE